MHSGVPTESFNGMGVRLNGILWSAYLVTSFQMVMMRLMRIGVDDEEGEIEGGSGEGEHRAKETKELQ